METERILTEAYAALERMREAADAVAYAQAASELADAFRALDSALTRGGYLPAMWVSAR